jgi:tripeptidyl-peptidase-1
MNLSYLLLALISVCAASGFAARSQLPYAVVESHGPPPQWKKLGLAPKDRMFQMKIGLKQDGFDELERTLYQGGTPRLP